MLAILGSLLMPGGLTSAQDPGLEPLDQALIEAAWANDVETARELIAKGADVNAKDETVQSAYLVATSEGYLDLLELTLEHGADVASLDWYQGTGLIRSAERGHWRVVGRLLQAEIDPDHVNRLGWTALHEAIILGDGSQDYIDTIRLLVAGGADLDLATGTGERPLDLARLAGQTAVEDTIRSALEADLGLEPDAALIAAVERDEPDSAAVAIRLGASVNATDHAGVSALDLADAQGRHDIARVLAALGATHDPDPATTSPGRSPQVQASPRSAVGAKGRFRMNLYSEGDFVHQQTDYWCVAAAAQTMMNIMDDGKPRRSKARQKRLHLRARRLYEDGDAFWREVAGESRWRAGHHGLDIRDWAGLLETSGYGRYVVERAPTRKRAIRMAAAAIRATGRPAGLVVWRGAHAWVMSGFVSTADPAESSKFKVTKVFVQDPWYPSVSSIWGASRPPHAAVPVRRLGEDFLPYRRPLQRQPKRDGKYLMILPAVEPTALDLGRESA
jgi:ankyrin repeat protein